ncbi:MAG: glycerophosphodiester phosphodiesterase family protein [Thermodesulfobacteriota bacterium]
MALPGWLQRPIMQMTDEIYARIPRPQPERDKLNGCRIISHRGDHDNLTVFENTLASFDRILDAGVWGIELDIRWTRDLHPMVFHDASLKRLYGRPQKICDLTLSELKATAAIIPTLKEVIDRYARKLHLMAELKKEMYPDPVYQNRILRELFAGLEAGVDFHILSLAPELFNLLEGLPPPAFLPIAELDVGSLSELSIREGYGGVLGHYLLVTEALRKKHQKCHQGVGTGFINSKQALFRELNRGVDWIFSDQAVEMQNVCNPPRSHLKTSSEA